MGRTLAQAGGNSTHGVELTAEAGAVNDFPLTRFSIANPPGCQYE
jgi:hypothetical protein